MKKLKVISKPTIFLFVHSFLSHILILYLISMMMSFNFISYCFHLTYHQQFVSFLRGLIVIILEACIIFLQRTLENLLNYFPIADLLDHFFININNSTTISSFTQNLHTRDFYLGSIFRSGLIW